VAACFDSLQMVSETDGALRGQAVAVVLIRIAGMVEAVKSSGEEGLRAVSAGVQAMIQRVRRDPAMQGIVGEAIG
jgi:predicted lipoprotein